MVGVLHHSAPERLCRSKLLGYGRVEKVFCLVFNLVIMEDVTSARLLYVSYILLVGECGSVYVNEYIPPRRSPDVVNNTTLIFQIPES
jgi:hypothetical protein